MKRYAQWSPATNDATGLAIPDRQDWLVAPCISTRDDCCLAESNWGILTRDVEAADEDGEDHEVHRFGYWACGWFEILLVRPDSKAAEVAAGIEERLNEYAILDEEDLCEREMLARTELWETLSLAERISVCN